MIKGETGFVVVLGWSAGHAFKTWIQKSYSL